MGSYNTSGNGGGAQEFTDLTKKTANLRDQFIVHLECKNCNASHKNVYYKRLTNPSQITSGNPYEAFVTDFSSARHGVYNTDFALFSTLQDALDGVKQWSQCAATAMNQNAADKRGMPGDCKSAAGQGSN